MTFLRYNPKFIINNIWLSIPTSVPIMPENREFICINRQFTISKETYCLILHNLIWAITQETQTSRHNPLYGRLVRLITRRVRLIHDLQIP